MTRRHSSGTSREPCLRSILPCRPTRSQHRLLRIAALPLYAVNSVLFAGPINRPGQSLRSRQRSYAWSRLKLALLVWRCSLKSTEYPQIASGFLRQYSHLQCLVRGDVQASLPALPDGHWTQNADKGSHCLLLVLTCCW